MTQLIDLNGVRLNELQTNPALYPSTYFLIQNGTDKAENSNISILENYLNITTRINNSIANHLSSIDPHGDRAYTNSLLNNHLIDVDAHGHKTYTNNTVLVHSQSPDPHGDRVFASQLMTSHNGLSDPHGHKAYANLKIAEHEDDTSAHNIQSTVNNTINGLRGTLNGFAPLDNNEKIPSAYLPTSNVSTIFVFSLPAIGVSNVVYVNMTDKSQYYWTGTGFEKLSSFDLGGVSLTTNDVTESTTNPNRRYYTSATEAALINNINLRINNGLNLGTDVDRASVFKEKLGSTLYFRTIIPGDGILIEETATSIRVSKEPESVIETEPTEFILQTRTFPSNLTSVLTLDGETLNETTYENTLNVPSNGLTYYEGSVIVSKVKQGSNLAQLGKYNSTEETRVWKVKLLISSYQDWTSTVDPKQTVNLLSTSIVEEMISGSSNTSAVVTATINETNKALLLNVQSNNDLNYVYLWKATFKKTFLRHASEGTINHE